MIEQMPAEMREQAERLRLAAGGYYERVMLAGAEALDRLADVRKTYEEWCAWTAGNDVDEDVELLLSDISMAIHGENFRDSSERG